MSTTHAPVVVHVRAYGAAWRAAIGTLLALGRTSPVALLVLVLFATDNPVTPEDLARLFVVLTLLPSIAAWALQRPLAASLEIGARAVVLRRRDVTLEIPCDAVARVVPWMIPLPGPGFWFAMRSGRRLRYGVQVVDPALALAALADLAGIGSAHTGARRAVVVHAHAKATMRPWRWYHLLLKYVVFGLAPAAVLFNAHQHIAYGGSLGQYYIYGLVPYVLTFGVYWRTTTIYLVLYASVWRGVAEAMALATAAVAPSHAARARRAVELACTALYYGGVPLLVLVRFLA